MPKPRSSYKRTRRPGVFIHVEMPHDHPFYAKVGRIASEWAHVEHALDRVIWKLAPIHEIAGACITGQIMGVAPRCRAICLLVTFHNLPATLIKRTRQLMNESHAIADLRNRAVHDPWFAMEASGEPAQFKSMAYSDPIYGMTSMTQEEMDDTLVEIGKFKKAVHDLRDEFFKAIRAAGIKPALSFQRPGT